MMLSKIAAFFNRDKNQVESGACAGDIGLMRSELIRAQRIYGLYSDVARQLGVSPNHVRQVGLGLRKSQRVEDALLAAFNRSREAA